MAIINNAQAGSQISLLCMIYRVISRNSGTLSVDDIQSLCAPPSLPALPDHKKRFPDNLRFWMKDSHQLWHEDKNAKLVLTRVATSEDPTAIAVVTNEALFANPAETIFGKKDKNDTEGLFRALGCVLAVDQFTIEGKRRLNRQNMQEFYAEQLRDFIPNDSEKIIIQRYGHFLGFFSMDASGEYVVDPTRALQGVLNAIFDGARELSVEQFLDRLAKQLPVLDRGSYRIEIEKRMVGPVSSDMAARKISASLSLAIERLKAAGILDYSPSSDDLKACVLQTRGASKRISRIQYLAGGVGP